MVSRWTCLAIQGNETSIVDTPERTECWLMKEGHPHALLLSCPLEKKAEMQQFVAEIKAEAGAIASR